MAFVRVVLFLLPYHIVYCGEYLSYNINVWDTVIYNPRYPTRKIPLIIHYPNVSSPNNFPIMVFNHGGDCKNTFYDYLWKNLVPEGYIVAMPGDFEHFWDYPHEYAAAQRYTLDWLRSSCNNNQTCPLYQIVGNKSVCSGHSWGGSATFLSISNYPLNETFLYEFDAAITLSGCGGRNVELSEALGNTPNDKSIFFIGGTHDCVCSKNDSNKYYNEVPTNRNICKFAGDIYNGTHCNMEEASPFGQEECEALEYAECPFANHDDVSASKQHDIINTYMTLFLNATMKQNRSNESIQQIKNQLKNDQTSNAMTNIVINCN